MPTKNMNDGNLIERVNALEKELRSHSRQFQMLIHHHNHVDNLVQEHELRLIEIARWIERHTDDCK